MIKLLRDDAIIEKVGGRFKLTSLIQKRWLELMRGARPLVPTKGKTDLEIIMDEIMEDKISIDYEASGMTAPDASRD